MTISGATCCECGLFDCCWFWCPSKSFFCLIPQAFHLLLFSVCMAHTCSNWLCGARLPVLGYVVVVITIFPLTLVPGYRTLSALFQFWAPSPVALSKSPQPSWELHHIPQCLLNKTGTGDATHQKKHRPHVGWAGEAQESRKEAVMRRTPPLSLKLGSRILLAIITSENLFLHSQNPETLRLDSPQLWT